MLRLNSPKKCIGPKLSLQVCILRRRHSRATGNLSAIYQQFIRPFSADEFEDNFKVLCLLRFQRPIMRTSIQFIANWNCWETYFKHQRCSSSHNSLRSKTHSITHQPSPNILLRSPSAHSNSMQLHAIV